VFVSPEYQVDKFGQHRLGYYILVRRTVFYSEKDTPKCE
jgi:hypothetical protein